MCYVALELLFVPFSASCSLQPCTPLLLRCTRSRTLFQTVPKAGGSTGRSDLPTCGRSCRTLQISSGGRHFAVAPLKNIATVTLIVDNHNGVAFATGSTIRLSAEYVESHKPGNSKAVRTEITGVLYHESCHVWQNNKGPANAQNEPYFTGVVEGIADWVRIRAKYPAAHCKKEHSEIWWEGYEKTAFFLDWIQTTKKANFVDILNRKMGQAPWSNDFFRQIVGKSVDQLWREYQNSF